MTFSGNLTLYLYHNPLICDHRVFWIKVGHTVGWLTVALAECSNTTIITWNNASIPEPPKPRNECIDGTNFCVSNAHCKNTIEPYECLCRAGFIGSGLQCMDINECEAGTHNCSGDTECFNSIGSFSCHKKCGFTDNGTTCNDYPLCPSGTYLLNGAYCVDCPLNTFYSRENHTSAECISCPSEYITKTAGSRFISQCKRE